MSEMGSDLPKSKRDHTLKPEYLTQTIPYNMHPCTFPKTQLIFFKATQSPACFIF